MNALWITYLVVLVITSLGGCLLLAGAQTAIQEQVALLITLTTNVSLFLACKAIESASKPKSK
jgi:hypothetical protein